MKKLFYILIWILFIMANIVYAQNNNDNYATNDQEEVWTYPIIRKTNLNGDIQFIDSGSCIHIFICNLSGNAVIEYIAIEENRNICRIKLS